MRRSLVVLVLAALAPPAESQLLPEDPGVTSPGSQAASGLLGLDPSGRGVRPRDPAPPTATEPMGESVDPERFRIAWVDDPAEYRRALAQARRLPGEGVRVSSPWTRIAGGIYHFDGMSHRAGRMTSAAYAYDHAQGRTTLFLGSTGGGLWKVVYAGIFAFWAPISETLQGSPAVGAFAVDPNNSNRILIATGDSTRYTGSGVYRTLDGGATWAQVNLGTALPGAFERMLVDRANASVVLLSGDTGIWRSPDFGGSWVKVYSGSTSDLAQHPTSLGTWWAGAPGVGLLKSINSGSSFSPAPGNVNLTTPIGRVSVAVSESSPNYLYALLAAPGGTLNGVYRSSNSGGNWVKIYNTDDVSFGVGFQSNAIAVHPSNPDIVIVGQGGSKMTSNATAALPTWGAVQRGHDDVTSIVFVPQSIDPGNTNVIVTNDGGYYVVDYVGFTYNGDGNRLGLEAEQVVGPYNSLAAARTDPTILYAGLQDNGLIKLDTDASTKLTFQDDGDGGQVSVSPDNAAHVFYSLGLQYNRAYSLASGFHTSKVLVQCGFSQPWAPSVLRDPTPGLGAGAEMFTFETPEQARVTGSQNLALNPLSASEILSINLNGITRTASLAAGDTDVVATNKVNLAMTAAGHAVSAQSAGGNLFIFANTFGAGQTLTVTSNRGSGVGTTGFGTIGLTDVGRDSNAWYKTISSTCDWAKVNPTRFPVTPAAFIPNMIDQANNTSQYVFYVTSEDSGKLIVLDQAVHGLPGAMDWEDRTPTLPGTNNIDGAAFADRSALQPNTVYYTTGRSRPSRAFLSTARGDTSPQSWQDVTGDLATQLPSANYWELVANPANLNELYLATDVGIMRSDDHGQHWYRYMAGLPAVINVMDVELSYDLTATPMLRIGTFGRGFWERQLGTADYFFGDGFESGNTLVWDSDVP
jgi:hypothetical protein